MDQKEDIQDYINVMVLNACKNWFKESHPQKLENYYLNIRLYLEHHFQPDYRKNSTSKTRTLSCRSAERYIKLGLLFRTFSLFQFLMPIEKCNLIENVRFLRDVSLLKSAIQRILPWAGGGNHRPTLKLELFYQLSCEIFARQYLYEVLLIFIIYSEYDFNPHCEKTEF